jgi:hypothetical protein
MQIQKEVNIAKEIFLFIACELKMGYYNGKEEKDYI